MSSFNDIQKILWKTEELKKENKELSEDEILSKIDSSDFRKLEFGSRGDAYHTKEVINKLFQKAKGRWS